MLVISPRRKSRRRRRYAFIQFSARAEAVAALDHPEAVLADPRIRLNWANHNFENARTESGRGC